ncbi:MAG: hypothetical protein WBO09_19385 [Methylocystis silviterrae]|uniref:hypothetical protein n=1 Tax=Methylocystis silviterrae TaxID=2743612 RepID=UPI003C71291C
MRIEGENNHYYDAEMSGVSLFGIAVALAIAAAIAAVAWLDAQPLQVVGWILFPIEYLLNAVFFPEVQTPLRSNAVALFIALPTFALLYAVYRLSKALFSLVKRSRSERP